MKKCPSGEPGTTPQTFPSPSPTSAEGGGERGPDGSVCFVGSSALEWVVLVARGDRPNLNQSVYQPRLGFQKVLLESRACEGHVVTLEVCLSHLHLPSQPLCVQLGARTYGFKV